MPDDRNVSGPGQRVFMASSHRAVAGTLLHGLRDAGAVAALTGESGLGKSLLLRHLLEEMGKLAGSVLTVPGRAGTAPAAWAELRGAVLRTSGLPARGLSTRETAACGLLVIEDAHAMSAAQLLDVAALLVRTPRALRPRLVFVAQPQFWPALSSPGLAGLRDAIETRAVLFPMVYTDAGRYVAHLLGRAGTSPKAVLGGPALHALLLRTEGNPHRINVELGRILVGAPIMPGAWRTPRRPGRRGRVAAGLLAATALAVAALAALDTSELPGGGALTPAEPASTVTTAPFEPPVPMPASDAKPSEPVELATADPAPQPDSLNPDSPTPDSPTPDLPTPAPALGGRVAVQPVLATQTALPDGTVAVLIRRGDEMVALKDIAAARLFYERAARAGSAPAALLLGGTFDPALVEGDRADAGAAAVWYGLAAALGSADAPARLTRVAKAAPG